MPPWVRISLCQGQKKGSKHCFGRGRLIFYWIFGDINENLIGCCSKPACGVGKSLISVLPIIFVYYIQHWSSKTLTKVCSQLNVVLLFAILQHITKRCLSYRLWYWDTLLGYWEVKCTLFSVFISPFLIIVYNNIYLEINGDIQYFSLIYEKPFANTM